MSFTNLSIRVKDAQGVSRQTDVPVSAETYKLASENGQTLSQYINASYPTDEKAEGTAYQQMLTSAGLAVKPDIATGLTSSRMSNVLNGGPQMAVVRPDGTQALTVAGRILFPSVILELMNHALLEDNTAYEGVYNSFVAKTTTVDSERVDQPVVNVTAPRNSRSQSIAQMAEPTRMVSISLSDRSYNIQPRSIGFEISEQAQKSTTLDYVSTILTQQIIGERGALIDEYLGKMLNGDIDLGLSALTSENISSYDPLATGGVVTNKAWIKWLRKDWRKLNIDTVICDLDTFLAVQNRVGRPIIVEDAGNDTRLTSLPTLLLPNIPGQIKFFPVDTALIGANTMVGIDSRVAIHRMVYASGSYSAIESYIMRRSTAMRFDFAEMSTRLYPKGDGWKKLILA